MRIESTSSLQLTSIGRERANHLLHKIVNGTYVFPLGEQGRGGGGGNPSLLGLTQAAPGDDGPGVAGCDALQHRGLVHRQREVLRANQYHGVLVDGGVGACKDSIIVKRHLFLSCLIEILKALCIL